MFYVVRHSERLDEVDRYAWRESALRSLNKPNQSRSQDSVFSDPPITPNGLEIANRAGESLIRLIAEHHPALEGEISSVGSHHSRIRIYSSRLMRCLQTSICIARKLGIKELYVSRGLALTAAAVDQLRHSFDFLTLEEIMELTEGEFVIHECDDWELDHAIHPADWYRALHDVSRHSSDLIKVVVAHRETIRNLMSAHMRLPYCAIAVCHHAPHSEDVTVGKTSIERGQFFHVPVIYDCDGTIIHKDKKKSSSSR